MLEKGTLLLLGEREKEKRIMRLCHTKKRSGSPEGGFVLGEGIAGERGKAIQTRFGFFLRLPAGERGSFHFVKLGRGDLAQERGEGEGPPTAGKEKKSVLPSPRKKNNLISALWAEGDGPTFREIKKGQEKGEGKVCFSGTHFWEKKDGNTSMLKVGQEKGNLALPRLQEKTFPPLSAPGKKHFARPLNAENRPAR